MSGPGELVSEAVKEMVKDKGFPVHMDSPYCKEYKKEHESCRGCESEEGCKKAAQILLLVMEAQAYEPKSFSEYQQVNQNVAKQIAELLTNKEE